MSRTQDESNRSEPGHSIDEATLENHNNQIMESAQEFQAHIEQLSSWKLQLAQQMEVLRRDGLKLLEKQKRLAEQKHALGLERETANKDRAELEESRKEVTAKQAELTQRQAELDERAAQIEDAGAKLQELLEEKERYLVAISESKGTLESLRVEQIKAGENLQELTRAAEAAKAVAAEKDQWLQQIAEARQTLKELAATQQEIAAQQETFKQQVQALAAREATLASQAATLQQHEVSVLEQQAQVEAQQTAVEKQRKALVEAELSIGKKTTELEGRAAEIAAQADELNKRSIAAEKSLKEFDIKQAEITAKLRQISDAEARLAETKAEIADAEAKLNTDRQWVSDAHMTLSKLQEQLSQRALEMHKQVEAAGKRHDAARNGGEQIAKLTSDLAAKEEQIAALETTLRQQEATLAANTAAAASAADAKQAAELSAIQTKLDTSRQELNARAAELAALQEMLAEQKLAVAQQEEQAGAALAKAEALDQEVNEKTAQLKEAEKALQDREAKIEQVVETLKTSQARIAEREKQLEEQAAALQSSSVTSAAADGDFRKQFDGERKSLREKLSQLQRQTTELSAARATLELQVAELTSHLQTVTDEAEETLQRRLSEQKTQYEQFVTSKQTQVSELQKQLKAQQTKYEQELASTQASYEQTLTQLQATQASVQAQPELAETEDAAKLTAALGALEQRYTAIKSERDTLEQQVLQLAKSQDEWTLSSNTLQAKLLAGEEKIAELQAEKGRLEELRGATETPVNVDAENLREVAARMDRQRAVLFRQAKKQRQRLWGVRERQRTIDHHWESIAKERAELVQKKTALEQIKRLLEKQELVMARKLADHSAVKTVAAVGIFVIMILGSSLAGVYQFVNPLYRSEAVVKLTPPGDLKTAELNTWMSQQVVALRSPDVLAAAWTTLRNTDNYNMHESKDAFVASLPSHLTLALEGKNVLVQYTGPAADGVAQVCNAISGSYAGRVVEATLASDNPIAKVQAAQQMIAAKATPPAKPIEDQRLMWALAVAGGALAVSLIVVMIMRHFIYRQLREIDQMADEEDLDNLKGDMPVETQAV